MSVAVSLDRDIVLVPRNRPVLEAVLRDPNPETWDAAYLIALRPQAPINLWCAVRLVDPTCPSRKVCAPDAWKGYVPSAFTLRRALQEVTR